MPGFQPFASLYALDLGLRPRLVCSGPLALDDELYRNANFALAAGGEAALEAVAFGGVAGELEGFEEVRAGDGGASAAKLELADGGEVEGVGGERGWIGDGGDLLQAALGAFGLGDGDGAVEGDDGRGAEGE